MTLRPMARQYIADANANVSANVKVAAVTLDSEVFFSVGPGSPPDVVAAVRRKNELIYNLTREFFPDPKVAVGRKVIKCRSQSRRA